MTILPDPVSSSGDRPLKSVPRGPPQELISAPALGTPTEFKLKKSKHARSYVLKRLKPITRVLTAESFNPYSPDGCPALDKNASHPACIE